MMTMLAIKVATDVTWANGAVRQAVLPVLHDAGLDGSASAAQEAAEWMNADGHMTTALTAKLARAICNAGAPSVALNAGTAAELPCGYWLIVADDDAIAQGEAGTAPIMALVGGSAVTVKPKAATPKVPKARAGGQHRRLAEGRRRHGRRRPVLAPLCHGPRRGSPPTTPIRCSSSTP